MSEKRRRWIPETAPAYSEFIQVMQNNRTSPNKRKKRKPLTKKERTEILLKTDGRCHICGGAIEAAWEADHVLPHSAGGNHSIENYLPAHSVCNNYRWFYSPDEFQEVMRLGIWLRTQIANKSRLGMQTAEQFVKHEQSRIKRRKSNTS